MRLTINISDKLSENLKREAANRGKSVSSIASEAIEHYLVAQRKLAMGQKVLDLVGKVEVPADIYDLIEEGRRDDRP